MNYLKNALNWYTKSALIILLIMTACSGNKVQRTYPCYKLDIAPHLDGKIESDKAWQNIPVETGFTTEFIKEFDMNFPPTKQTFFKMGYDSLNLYVAVKCMEPWVKQLETKKDINTFNKDDGIELLLQTDNNKTVHHFIINAIGSRWSGESIKKETTALDDWEAKTYIAKDFFSMEVKIPFKKLQTTPEPNTVWLGNIGRNIITIICPEDRKTSWSPVNSEFDESENFGRFVFKDEKLIKQEATKIENNLKKQTDKIFADKQKKLQARQQEETRQLQTYQKSLNNRATGITGLTHGKADLISPSNVPKNEIWRYGLGFPLQISPTEVALLCNVRKEGSGNIDFEIGTDVVVFDDLSNIKPDNAIGISRYETGRHPKTGHYIVRKGPVLGGFVPVGAKLEDGTPHPYAGTGFGMCWAIKHNSDKEGRFDYRNYTERYAMMFQFAYDGKIFKVTEKQPVDEATLLSDWKLVGNFVTNAIPDGKDLLYVMISRVNGIAVAGVTRWQYGAKGWRPVSFTPVTGDSVTWSEPSLIREADGNLLFSARSSDRAIPTIAFDIGVWRSVDNGETWNQVLYEKNRRSRSPVSINCAADGTPFICANTPPLRRVRDVLSIWPINETRTALECRMVACDAKKEFGPAPSGSWWRIDHPNSAIVRLADEKWHSILTFRIVDNGEIEGSAHPAPETGCYVEEVFSKGTPIPTWNF